MDRVDLRLYLAGQGQPGDRHVGVQHLEFGLQRQSHTRKKKETSIETRNRNRSERPENTQAVHENTSTSAVYAAGDVTFIVIMR